MSGDVTMLDGQADGTSVADTIVLGRKETPDMAAYREELIAAMRQKFAWACAGEAAEPAPLPVYHPAPLGPGASVDPALAFRDQFQGAIRRLALYQPDRGVPSC